MCYTGTQSKCAIQTHELSHSTKEAINITNNEMIKQEKGHFEEVEQMHSDGVKPWWQNEFMENWLQLKIGNDLGKAVLKVHLKPN